MTLDRRDFLSVLGGASLGGASLGRASPGRRGAEGPLSAGASPSGGSLEWPDALRSVEQELGGGGGPEDESFWAVVRRQFLIPEGRIYLNNGTLGPSPRIVVDAVTEHTRRVASTLPPGVAWDDLKRSVASLLGGDPEGYVFPRNTTEGMSFVAHGLELGPGDEILTTDHEHIGGLEPWRLVAARRGAALTVARLPVPAEDEEQLLEAIWEGVTPRTRVLSVSHLTFTTGTRLPVEALAVRCARSGITLVVDGAHPPGMLTVDLAAVGGDFYATSPHKWLLAPQGTGLLYLGEPWRERLWPTLASGGWDDVSLGAHRFNHLGTFDESRLAGLLSAVEFMTALGMSRVEARVRLLCGRLESGLRSIRGVSVVTPTAEALKGAVVAFSIDGVESSELQRHLSRVANVRTRVIGEYDYGWMRLSTHVYNTPEEVDRVLELLSDAARNGIPA